MYIQRTNWPLSLRVLNSSTFISKYTSLLVELSKILYLTTYQPSLEEEQLILYFELPWKVNFIDIVKFNHKKAKTTKARRQLQLHVLWKTPWSTDLLYAFPIFLGFCSIGWPTAALSLLPIPEWVYSGCWWAWWEKSSK